MDDQYIWLIWSLAFLVPWGVLYVLFPQHRQAMVWASLFTMPFGLTEPLFVPSYWSPPSLFDLAIRTGFDIESLIFCFGIGGVAAVLFDVIAGTRIAPVPCAERNHPRHRFHGWAIASPFIAFVLIAWFPWNAIYPAIVAMTIGAIATSICRPDLITSTIIGAVSFVTYYTVFFAGLEWLSPGYVDEVWNLEALTGIYWLGIPLEEVLFAASFGAMWAGIFHHFRWRHRVPGHEG